MHIPASEIKNEAVHEVLFLADECKRWEVKDSVLKSAFGNLVLQWNDGETLGEDECMLKSLEYH